MKARLRSAGIGGTIAALLTTGALLLPAASAQALPSRGQCEVVSDMYHMAVYNNDIPYAWELLERWWAMGC
jgi:hypothetical protein